MDPVSSLMEVAHAMPAAVPWLLPSALGLAQAAAGLWLLRRFQATPESVAPVHPAITILKPLAGTEPLLRAALRSFCRQDYPEYQIVFGVHAASDAAVSVVQDLQREFPDRAIDLVIDSALHGCNRKISNLINMLPVARYDVLVLADSDIHAAPDYLARLADALAQPEVGLATTVYTGRPAQRSLAARLGAMQITHNFLPGALLGRALGRQDCLGATMALTRATLMRIGGLETLADHLADDAVLGQKMRALGLNVALAATIPATTVPEATLRSLWQHELRWARTVRSLAPLGHAASMLQYPIAWAMLAAAILGFSPSALVTFLLVWLLRARICAATDRALGTGQPTALLLPLRELLSIGAILASYTGNKVIWGNHVLRASSRAAAAARAPAATLPTNNRLVS